MLCSGHRRQASVVRLGDRRYRSEAFSLGKQSPTTFTAPETRMHPGPPLVSQTETGPSACQPDAERGAPGSGSRPRAHRVCSTGGLGSPTSPSGASAAPRRDPTWLLWNGSTEECDQQMGGCPPLFSRGNRSQNCPGCSEPDAEGGPGPLRLGTRSAAGVKVTEIRGTPEPSSLRSYFYLVSGAVDTRPQDPTRTQPAAARRASSFSPHVRARLCLSTRTGRVPPTLQTQLVSCGSHTARTGHTG